MIGLARWLGWNLVVYVLKTYSSCNDPHKWLAAHMLGKPESKVTIDERMGCKHSLYNALYGRRPGK